MARDIARETPPYFAIDLTGPQMNPLRFRSLSAVILVALAGCTASPASAPADAGPSGPAPTSIVVTLAPLAAEVRPGGSVSFTASVTGAADTGIAWAVQEGTPGGTVDTTGLYTAPATTGTFHVIAASRADPAKFLVAAVTVAAAPVAVRVVPASSAVDACGTVTFSATVSGAASTGVRWEVKEGSAGGTITQGGTYTAPATAGTYHVAASSLADPTQAAEATVIVGPEKVLSVAVNPGSAAVAAGGAVAFSATVTTSCGSFAAN